MKLHRKSTTNSLSTLIHQIALEQNSYYVKSIIVIIQFLVVNELFLPGNYILEEKKEQGLFQNLFEYTSMKDTNLKVALIHAMTA